MRTSIFLFSLVFVFSCETEVKNVDSCGDSLIDPSEQCDGAELGGVTCENLGYYNKLGEVSCRPDCTLDLTACGNRCGDGTVETDHQEQCDGENLNSTSCVSLNFTNGGTLACTADCTFDTSACLTTCGNGNLETGEACDDGNEDPGDGCAADCSLEEGWICEGETISTCRPFCDPGLAYCAGECFDLANDPAHCGTCGHACGGGQLCAGSTCRLPEAAWEDAGSFASFMYNVRTTRYAISECPDGPFLWAIDTTAVPITHLMYKLGVAGEQWGPVDPPLDTGIVESYALDGGLAVACRGGVRVAAYSLGGGDTELAVRWLDTDAGLWKRFGDAALVSQCGGTDYLGMIVDSTDSLHVLSNGSGGCGFSVDYAWWDGSQWQAHPSMTNMPRQLTQNSAGNPSIATYGQTVYLGIAHHLELPILHTAHEVWTWQNDAWTQVGPDLDEGMGLNNGAENMSLAVSAAGRLCAAFVKTMEFVAPVPAQKIFVKCYDPEGNTWNQLGATELNSDHNATAPSLAFVGNVPYLAYQRRVTVNDADLWHVNVVRWNPQTEVWDLLASEMETAPDYDSFRPRLVTHQGQVFVSFLQGDEDTMDAANLYVKKP